MGNCKSFPNFAGMKAKLFIIGLFLFALAACTSTKVPEPVEGPSPELCAIDSLLWHQPDSALLRLLPWFDTCCRDAACHVSTAMAYNRHYANLLLSELLYKNDYPQTNRVELLQAVGYFDSLVMVNGADTHGVSLQARPRRDTRRASAQNIAFLDARAHYINGVGYYENDSVVEACKEYMKALEVMEGYFDEKQLVGKQAQFMALTYTRLTDLYSNSYLHEQAIYFGQQSIYYYQMLVDSSWHLAWILDEIGSHFEMMEQIDSASFYYQKAIATLGDTSVLMYRDINNHLIQLKYKMGGLPETSIQQLHQLLSITQDDKEKLARCIALGEIFYYEKQFDSAQHYLNKVFWESSNTGSKKQAAEWLIEISRTQGKEDQIHEYVNYLIPFANLEENKSAIKSQLTELYKTFNQRIQEQLHQQEKKMNQELVLGLLIVMSTIAILYHKNKRKRRHLEVQIKEEQLSHEMQQKSLSGRLRKSNEALRGALIQIEGYEAEKEAIVQDIIGQSNGKERYETFRQTSICHEILDRVYQLHADKRTVLKTDMEIKDYKSFALSDMDLAQLIKALDSCFPEIMNNLKLKDPSLSHKDWLYLGLYLLQLDKMSICVLLQESYHTCRRYTMKLERAFHCQHGLTSFLLEQVNAL